MTCKIKTQTFYQ
uniref:Uncharacterized protein n=1 Tax=Rhizophora mucronata TaxID=61149 RepID=A0A2P2IZ94_RHIMU